MFRIYKMKSLNNSDRQFKRFQKEPQTFIASQ